MLSLYPKVALVGPTDLLHGLLGSKREVVGRPPSTLMPRDLIYCTIECLTIIKPW